VAYDPERVGEQKIDDDEIGKAQQRAAEQQRQQRAMGSRTISDYQTRQQNSQAAMGSTATQATASQGESEEQEISM